jgi:hypothetical protein
LLRDGSKSASLGHPFCGALHDGATKPAVNDDDVDPFAGDRIAVPIGEFSRACQSLRVVTISEDSTIRPEWRPGVQRENMWIRTKPIAGRWLCGRQALGERVSEAPRVANRGKAELSKQMRFQPAIGPRQ